MAYVPGTDAPAPIASPAAAELTEELQEHMTPEYWTRELQAARKWFQRWHELARSIERRYLLHARDAERGMGSGSQGDFPLFWSNVETILASMYGQVPKVSVDRTHLDPNDDAARVAAVIIERIFDYEADDLENSPYYIMQDCIQDRLVSGMGVAWARYEFDEEQIPLAEGLMNPDGTPVTMSVITEERAPIDYVRWEDFLYSPCRRWIDKRWLARRVPMSRQQLFKRFGEAALNVPLSLKGAPNRQNRDDDPLRAQVEDQADVWEIWCVTTRTAYWYVQGHERLLDTKQDPLALSDFFPVRRPLIATHLTNAFLPRPDYVYAKSQYEEMELIAQRCTMLTEALKLVGVYDKTADGVQRMLNQAAHNQLIPVDNWAMFAEKGGIKGMVDWLPLEMVVKTLEYLTARKVTLSTEVFELLGISDIQRGMSIRSETATTQRLKAQFGSARATKATAEIARFVTDCYRMRAEIICRHWQPQTIMTVSQIDKTPDAQLAPQAIQLMKTDPTFAMRVKISADNVTAPDWELEKSLRVDFLGALSGFLASASPMVDKYPGTAKSMLQIIQWVASGFKGAKAIEGVMDQALAGLAADQAKPKEPPPPTAQDKKDVASAQKAHADARKSFAETAKVLAELGLPVEYAYQLPPQFDPSMPGGAPPAPAALPGAGSSPSGVAPVPPGPVPAGPAGSMASPPGNRINMGGAPMRPPAPMPNIPGLPPQ